MVIQQGSTALVRVRAATHTGSVARDGWAVAEFWSPGKDPRGSAADRAAPDCTVECEWDEASRAWVAMADTEGWAPGTWAVRGYAQVSTAHGPAKGWSWGTLEVAP